MGIRYKVNKNGIVTSLNVVDDPITPERKKQKHAFPEIIQNAIIGREISIDLATLILKLFPENEKDQISTFKIAVKAKDPKQREAVVRQRKIDRDSKQVYTEQSPEAIESNKNALKVFVMSMNKMIASQNILNESLSNDKQGAEFIQRLASGALKSKGGLQYIEKIALDLESLSEKILDKCRLARARCGNYDKK